MSTKFAPGERAEQDILARDYHLFGSLKNINEFLNALPYVVAILNPERQIVYSNNALINMLNVNSIEELLGQRPGEAISCINSGIEDGGCGTSDRCKYCGAVRTILKCQRERVKVSDECRITSVIDGKEVAFDLLVTASPIYIEKREYSILSLSDISNEKRRKALERIFFHDIINTAGSLNSLIEIMKDVDETQKLKEFMELAGNTSKELIDEILAQRELLAAENNELKVNRTAVFTHDLLNELVMSIMHNEFARERIVIIDKNSINLTFTTDILLLKRVLVNMLKNALEATPVKGKVVIGCDNGDTNVLFWVYNSAFMPKDVQSQIFMRSFSTKGNNRGLGTYGMKLLGERYLNGKVFFESDEIKGTKFFIKLPL
jgi:K+-sensing histidine kinase KdpD